MRTISQFTIKCDTCGDVAKFALTADFDTAGNAALARFDLFCQRCGRQESMSVNAPKQDLLPIEADQEVKDAIRDAIG